MGTKDGAKIGNNSELCKPMYYIGSKSAKTDGFPTVLGLWRPQNLHGRNICHIFAPSTLLSKTIMKKVLYSLFVAACAAVLPTSCRVAAPSGDGEAVRFDTVRVDTVYQLRPDRETPRATVSVSMARPVAMADEGKLPAVQSFVVAQLRQGTLLALAGAHVERAVELYVDDYLASYATDATDALGNYGEDEEAGQWLNYEEIIEGRPLYNACGILCYAMQAYSYTGGAHGMTTLRYSVFDLATLSVLTLADVFDPEAAEPIGAMIRGQLMNDYDCTTLKGLEDFFTDPETIGVTENFYVDAAGVHWEYDPYEIGPYSTGVVTVALPWESLTEWLLPDSPVRRVAEAR